MSTGIVGVESHSGDWPVGAMEEEPPGGVWKPTLCFGDSALGFTSSCNWGDWPPRGRRTYVGEVCLESATLDCAHAWPKCVRMRDLHSVCRIHVTENSV